MMTFFYLEILPICIALNHHSIFKYHVTKITSLRPKYLASNAENVFRRSRWGRNGCVLGCRLRGLVLVSCTGKDETPQYGMVGLDKLGTSSDAGSYGARETIKANGFVFFGGSEVQRNFFAVYDFCGERERTLFVSISLMLCLSPPMHQSDLNPGS